MLLVANQACTKTLQSSKILKRLDMGIKLGCLGRLKRKNKISEGKK